MYYLICIKGKGGKKAIYCFRQNLYSMVLLLLYNLNVGYDQLKNECKDNFKNDNLAAFQKTRKLKKFKISIFGILLRKNSLSKFFSLSKWHSHRYLTYQSQKNEKNCWTVAQKPLI